MPACSRILFQHTRNVFQYFQCCHLRQRALEVHSSPSFFRTPILVIRMWRTIVGPLGELAGSASAMMSEPHICERSHHTASALYGHHWGHLNRMQTRWLLMTQWTKRLLQRQRSCLKHSDRLRLDHQQKPNLWRVQFSVSIVWYIILQLCMGGFKQLNFRCHLLPDLPVYFLPPVFFNPLSPPVTQNSGLVGGYTNSSLPPPFF